MADNALSNQSTRDDHASSASSTRRGSKKRGRRKRGWIRRSLRAWGWLFVILVGLFAVNGLWLASGESVVIGKVSIDADALAIREATVTSIPSASGGLVRQVKVMSWNIAKCFAHEGGISFADEADVRERLREMGEVIQREKPDLVFLSETIFECTPCSVNQVMELAKASGLKYWAFGENYNFGLPFYRVSGGNAILSRWPLAPLDNPDLPGRKPFWITKNNRRALWCEVGIATQRVWLCSVHTDSFDLANNEAQTLSLLSFSQGKPTILAGDFNARRDQPSIKHVESTKAFTHGADGTPTFPLKSEEIDFIFAPAAWKLLEYRVIQNDVSDHRPVVSVFQID